MTSPSGAWGQTSVRFDFFSVTDRVRLPTSVRRPHGCKALGAWLVSVGTAVASATTAATTVVRGVDVDVDVGESDRYLSLQTLDMSVFEVADVLPARTDFGLDVDVNAT